MKKLPLLSELRECPFCGSIEYYTIDQVKGHITSRSSFDGSEVDNDQMYEMISIKTGKFIFCGQCQTKIARNDTNKY